MDMEVLNFTKILNKMYKIVHSIFIVGILIFLSSCEKDADVKLPTVESKLVINSFISPQDTIVTVEVTLSQPLYNNPNSGQYSSITNATVQINDGVNTQTLVYNSTKNYYFISTSLLPILVGNTYFLTVSTPDGKNVSASAVIPSSNSTLTFSSQQVNNPSNHDKYIIEASWNDAAGTEDYYRLSFYNRYFYTGSNNDTAYSNSYSNLFSDKGSDGRIFNQNFEVYKSPFNMGSDGGELYLIHASKEYYLFHTKLTDAGNGGNPFSEPVQMYSNINGGYGVFAGFNQYKLHVPL